MNGGYRVFALVRGESQAHAEKRMNEVLRFWDVPPEVLRQRLVVLKSDICEESLGLNRQHQERLRHEVHLVLHAASTIRLNLSLEDARSNILNGTTHTWSFAQSCRHLKRFGFISSTEVAGDYQGIVREEFLTRYRRNFLNTYEIAKSESEEYLRGQLAQDPRISVFRVGMVVGEAKTGKALGFQSFYLLLEKMVLRPQWPFLPRGCPIDTIPVDVLACGIRRLMEYEEANGQVYQLCQGQEDRVSFNAFVGKARKILERDGKLTLKRATYFHPAFFTFPLRILRSLALGKMRSRIEIMLMFLKFSSVAWQFDNTQTRKALAALDVALPRFDDYFPRLLDYYLAHRDGIRLPF